MKLPYGWSPEYALRDAVRQIELLQTQVEELQTVVTSLEAEVSRLDVTKANRRGRPPKDSTVERQQV